MVPGFRNASWRQSLSPAGQLRVNLRARMIVGNDGRYAFTTVRPAPYTAPEDGPPPVGELLRATGRHSWRPSHLHFIAEGFFGLHAHGRSNPDSWKLGFPTLAAYRDEWLRQAAETAGTAFAEPLADALFRVATLRDIDIGDGVAVARKKFDGTVAKMDGTTDRLNWQTLYFCAKRTGVWKIASFVGYLPHPMGG